MAYKKYNSSSVLLHTFGSNNNKFYGDFYYDSYRSGTKMYYRLKAVLTLKIGGLSAYYNNKINAQFNVNGATVNTKEIKGTTNKSFTKETTWTSESSWYSFDKTTGTTSASVKIYDAVDGSWVNNTYSMTLPIVAAASSLGTISAFNLEKNFSVPVTKNSGTFTDTLEIKYGSTTIKTISDYTNNALIKLNSSEILIAYKAMGNSRSGTFTFNLTTKNGSTSVGTSSKTATGKAVGTLKTKANGVWKNSIPLVKVNGGWKRAIAFVKVNGVWKRGNP